MESDLYIVREQVLKGKLSINHLLAAYQIVDILTKPLLAKTFVRLRQAFEVTEANINSGKDRASNKSLRRKQQRFAIV